jgi:hypothetical protein
MISEGFHCVFDVINDGTLFNCNMLTALQIPALWEHYDTIVALNIRT